MYLVPVAETTQPRDGADGDVGWPELGSVVVAAITYFFGNLAGEVQAGRRLCLHQGPQELRCHQPDHPRLRQEEDHQGPFVHNDRLIDALTIQAFAALRISPGARTFYDDLRPRDRTQRRPAPAR